MILNLFCNRKIMSVKKLFEGGVSNLFAKARPVVSVEAKEKVINYLSEKVYFIFFTSNLSSTTFFLMSNFGKGWVP